MGEAKKTIQQLQGQGAFLTDFWRHKAWWLPALIILMVLVGIVYVMVHLSSTDSEMYPTSFICTFSKIRQC